MLGLFQALLLEQIDEPIATLGKCRESEQCHQTEELVRLRKPKPWGVSELRTVGMEPAPCQTT